jgi:DNA helicase II / ATP-dependent DNA helicase PcrA
MLTYNEFQDCVQTSVTRFSSHWLNPEQDDSVSSLPSTPVFIVAGPGTGKTTVLALRALRHIFVDQLSPESIIATTFTRKAASELRSRILSWGILTQEEAILRAKSSGNLVQELWLKTLDLNKVQTGTLDALCEDMLANDRQAGEITPTVVETFMAKGLLRKNIMFQHGRHKNIDLEEHLGTFNKQFPGVKAFGDKLKASHSFADRVLHDNVDLASYTTQGIGHELLSNLVIEYHQHLVESQLMDFALLEQAVLDRLKAGRLSHTTSTLKALLVDEFQDTNYLQEQIYYELCSHSNAALTVVGDDDQSIYRFRGATVEIFAGFENRIQLALGKDWRPVRIDLINNYRSSERIVEFCNHFITAESSFLSARAPGKDVCIASSSWSSDPEMNLPVLGLFRTTVEDLANDLSLFLNDVFRQDGHIVHIAEGKTLSIKGGTYGDFGDAVLLSPKVRETSKERKRLPLFMRKLLGDDQIFNPRGRDLSSIPDVERCLGIMLECIDPTSCVQNSILSMRQDTKVRLSKWRDAGAQFAATNPNPGGLQKFIQDWSSRNAPRMSSWPKEWPVLELLFTVVTWFPSLQRTPEGQVYLEAISRIIAGASQVASFRSSIKCGTPYEEASIKDAIREIFEPIAEGEVDIDEEIMPYVPKSVFPIMTIHQAKGLEFPLTIVDIGSDYKTNHHSQRPGRYPKIGADVHLVEDELASYSPVGIARKSRDAQVRAFDDLRRLFFVAQSRAQNVLLLVGLTSQLSFDSKKKTYKVLSVATGDLMDGSRNLKFIPSKEWSSDSSSDTVALI